MTKHGVAFDQASTIFGDPSALTIPDPEHSRAESRYITMGRAFDGKLLVVVHTDRGDKYPYHQRKTGQPARTQVL